MSHRTRLLLSVLIASALMAWASPASAHGIKDEAANRSILEFVPIGIEHMLLGWDHLLFVAGVVLIAGQAKLAAKLISLFVLGHSATLITATLLNWRVDPDVVDVIIALSVVFVAGVGLIGPPERFRWFGAAVLGFGLIHGLGLATRFQDLGFPDGGGELWRVLAFNVGIEIGQLMAIAVMAGLALLAGRLIAVDKRPRVAQLACAPIFVGGSVAAGLIALNAFTSPPEPAAPAALPTDTSCEVSSAKPWNVPGGTHPAKSFYGPDETAPIADFGHVIGDGNVIVMYPADSSTQDVERLRDYVGSPEGQGVLAGASPEISVVAVFQYRETMTCQSFEMDSIKAFSQTWLEEVRG